MKATLPTLRRRLLVLALAAASVGSAYAASTTAAPTTTKPDVVADHIDTSVKPGDDFFEFANGAWLKAHPIPPEESQWGIGQVVQDELYAKLRKMGFNLEYIDVGGGLGVDYDGSRSAFESLSSRQISSAICRPTCSWWWKVSRAFWTDIVGGFPTPCSVVPFGSLLSPHGLFTSQIATAAVGDRSAGTPAGVTSPITNVLFKILRGAS